MRKTELGRVEVLLHFNHEETVKKTGQLIQDLNHIHYEGRASFQKNLRRIRDAMHFFDGEIMHHLELEEETLFPYLETHVPKLYSAIRFLQAEHEAFRGNLKVFRFFVRELSRQKKDEERARTIDRLKETGTYLAYLLRHHIEAEEKSIYRSAERELRLSEKRELKNRVAKAMSLNRS